MKLENYKTSHVSIPFDRPKATGIHSLEGLENVLVEIESEGENGIGYACCLNSNQAKAIKVMANDLLEGIKGEDVSNIQKVWNDMWWKINFIGQAGPNVIKLNFQKL